MEENKLILVNDLPEKKKEYLKEIEERKQKYTDLVIDGIKDKAGYKAVYDAYQDMVKVRTGVTKYCKQARDKANAYSKAVIAEEKSILELLEPIEKSLFDKRKAIDDEVARIKAEEEAKETERIKKRRNAFLKFDPKITAEGTLELGTAKLTENGLINFSDEELKNVYNSFKEQYEVIQQEIAQKEFEEQQQRIFNDRKYILAGYIQFGFIEDTLTLESTEEEFQALLKQGQAEVKKRDDEAKAKAKAEEERLAKIKEREDKIAEEERKQREKEIADKAAEEALKKKAKDEEAAKEKAKKDEEARIQKLSDTEKLKEYYQKLLALPEPVIKDEQLELGLAEVRGAILAEYQTIGGK